MKKRFTEEQIIQLLAEIRAGKSVKELSREHGVTLQTIYTWKTKFGDMGTSEAQSCARLSKKTLASSACWPILASTTKS